MDIKKNKDEVFEWVKKVINSCETLKQNIASENLIYNFYRIYDDDDLYKKLIDVSLDNLFKKCHK